MNKHMVTFFLCCFASCAILAGIEKQRLFFNASNWQGRSVFLHCHVYHLTGEKESGFNHLIAPGKSDRFAFCHLKRGCKGSLVVKCKFKFEVHDYPVESFLIAIPCSRVTGESALELEITKENKLLGNLANDFKGLSGR